MQPKEDSLKTISLCHAVIENTVHTLLEAHEVLDYDDFTDDGKERLDMIQIRYRDILKNIQGIFYFVSDMEENLSADDESEVEQSAIIIEGIIKCQHSTSKNNLPEK